MIRRVSGFGPTVVAVALLVACGTSSPPVEPAPGMLLWVGDFETGDLSQFRDTPWNLVGGPPPDVVADPVRDGRYAGSLSILGATTPDDGICCGSRNELEPNFRDMQPGDDLWFAFSTYLVPGFPVDYPEFQTITQFKQNFDGSPPLELVVNEGQFRIEGGDGHPERPQPFSEPVGQAAAGRWIDWVLHVNFSPDPQVGYVEVWRDGELVLPRYAPETGTMYPNPDGGPVRSSVKTGYYRDRGIGAVGSIVFDDWRIGTTQEAVLSTK
jgi:hypothetical protein